ncbi:MAG: putative quinol monooxygenase [Candidatus Izemoplasma sp.]|nr:putative quinol monooxygenase [Candidatus Izemoplasma sp.]
MNTTFPMIVKFTVKKEHLDFVKEKLIELVNITKKEDGCILYELHQDKESSHVFVFYEVWQTQEHWAKHDQSPHVQKFLKVTDDCFERVEVNKLTKI